MTKYDPLRYQIEFHRHGTMFQKFTIGCKGQIFDYMAKNYHGAIARGKFVRDPLMSDVERLDMVDLKGNPMGTLICKRYE